jgi:hypothetical protein
MRHNHPSITLLAGQVLKSTELSGAIVVTGGVNAM